MPQHLKLLHYDYVEDIVERRAPHRAAHLELIGTWVSDGRVVAGGATGDPPSGALIVFRESGDPEEFVAVDPYVREGLVTSWRVEPWTVVTGDL
ncbi:MAG TPA: YciI family protein [Solirubrobacteraceae bacterium]|nr:YciI family protein [Solirubrobacteraceae bacterium]